MIDPAAAVPVADRRGDAGRGDRARDPARAARRRPARIPEVVAHLAQQSARRVVVLRVARAEARRRGRAAIPVADQRADVVIPAAVVDPEVVQERDRVRAVRHAEIVRDLHLVDQPADGHGRVALQREDLPAFGRHRLRLGAVVDLEHAQAALVPAAGTVTATGEHGAPAAVRAGRTGTRRELAGAVGEVGLLLGQHGHHQTVRDPGRRGRVADDGRALASNRGAHRGLARAEVLLVDRRAGERDRRRQHQEPGPPHGAPPFVYTSAHASAFGSRATIEPACGCGHEPGPS